LSIVVNLGKGVSRGSVRVCAFSIRHLLCEPNRVINVYEDLFVLDNTKFLIVVFKSLISGSRANPHEKFWGLSSILYHTSTVAIPKVRLSSFSCSM